MKNVALFWAVLRDRRRPPHANHAPRDVDAASLKTLPDRLAECEEEHPDVLAYVRATTAHLEPSA